MAYCILFFKDVFIYENERERERVRMCKRGGVDRKGDALNSEPY